MGFWSTLTALFVRDTVKAYSDAKKEVKDEIKKNHGFLHEWEYLDDESYKKYSPKCINFTNLMINTIDEIVALAEFSNEKANEVKKFVSAYPYYIVLAEQGGGVHEVQERFLKNIKKSEMCFSGEDIKLAAKNRNYSVAIELEENCALTENRFGKIWEELVSIANANKDMIKEKASVVVEFLSQIAVNFALMADVIVESELKETIVTTFENNAN